MEQSPSGTNGIPRARTAYERGAAVVLVAFRTRGRFEPAAGPGRRPDRPTPRRQAAAPPRHPPPARPRPPAAPPEPAARPDMFGRACIAPGLWPTPRTPTREASSSVGVRSTSEKQGSCLRNGRIRVSHHMFAAGAHGAVPPPRHLHADGDGVGRLGSSGGIVCRTSRHRHHVRPAGRQRPGGNAQLSGSKAGRRAGRGSKTRDSSRCANARGCGQNSTQASLHVRTRAPTAIAHLGYGEEQR